MNSNTSLASNLRRLLRLRYKTVESKKKMRKIRPVETSANETHSYIPLRNKNKKIKKCLS